MTQLRISSVIVTLCLTAAFMLVIPSSGIVRGVAACVLAFIAGGLDRIAARYKETLK